MSIKTHRQALYYFKIQLTWSKSYQHSQKVTSRRCLERENIFFAKLSDGGNRTQMITQKSRWLIHCSIHALHVYKWQNLNYLYWFLSINFHSWAESPAGRPQGPFHARMEVFQPSGRLSRFNSRLNLPLYCKVDMTLAVQTKVTGPRAAWPAWPGKWELNGWQQMTVTVFPTGTRRRPQFCLKIKGRAHWANGMGIYICR